MMRLLFSPLHTPRGGAVVAEHGALVVELEHPARLQHSVLLEIFTDEGNGTEIVL